MAYATSDDVEVSLGRALTSAESDQVEGWLDDAGYLIDGYLGVAFSDAFTDLYLRVSVNMVLRALSSASSVPAGASASSEGDGPFSRTVQYVPGASAGGVWLAQVDRVMLRSVRGGFNSLALRSEASGLDES